MTFIGTVLTVGGLFIILKPKFYNPIYRYSTYFDFTGYNIPLGICMIVLGLACLWTTWKGKH
jgi:hypothetical protein